MNDTAKFMKDFVQKILNKKSDLPYKSDNNEDNFFQNVKQHEQSKSYNFHTFIPYNYNNDIDSDSESYYSIDVLSDED
jgi:hypothetical protein